MKTTILISGATGNTGRPLVKQLTAAGVPVRAMIHTPEKRSMVEGNTVEVAVGDFKNRASLEEAMKGIESAYLVSPPALDQVRDQTAFVDAAKTMGVNISSNCRPWGRRRILLWACSGGMQRSRTISGDPGSSILFSIPISLWRTSLPTPGP